MSVAVIANIKVIDVVVLFPFVFNFMSDMAHKSAHNKKM